MARQNWHNLREEGAVIVTRRLPPRFDLKVEAEVATGKPVSLSAIAHQVRQDMWRRLQSLRGFAPAVRVERTEGGVRITAGGALEGARPTEAARTILSDLLDSPGHRARWLRHAERRHG
ncbi:hypothetical protein KM176_12080 [Pseudooceanicola sp. CBS1P-1]|uniref:Uncharacterized protein n=1 Tax=Pseudooceanicola albus TaxID=2692189 RepID=A0A6L7G2Q1_9RHOB|nr:MULTISPECIES: hypothetical protein [Pseudooceanicola]MBT9384600.1 hypothetical protein [Pseudooceanicola endophyticus]MXN18301.1 hypothetical protein [Pseudooceanicola albus]